MLKILWLVASEVTLVRLGTQQWASKKTYSLFCYNNWGPHWLVCWILLFFFFWSLQICHVYWPRRQSCVDCKWALLTSDSANVSTLLSFLPLRKVRLRYSYPQLRVWRVAVACLHFYTEKATVPVRRPSSYSYSLRWPSPTSPQSWERKWLPSVASPENYAIPSYFPYTLVGP